MTKPCLDCGESVGARPRARYCAPCARERIRHSNRSTYHVRRGKPAPRKTTVPRHPTTNDRAPAELIKAHMIRIKRVESVLRRYYHNRRPPETHVSDEQDDGPIWSQELCYVARVRWDVAQPILERAGLKDEWHWDVGEAD